MRSVILQENRTIRSRLSEIADEAAQLGALQPQPCRRTRAIHWRVRDVDAQRGAELGHSCTCAFELPEYPEVAFALRFGAAPCRLRLRVSGPGCAHLDLRVSLAAEVEEEGTLLGHVANVALLGGGRAACACEWPRTQGSTVLCIVRVELVGVKGSVLRCARTAHPRGAAEG